MVVWRREKNVLSFGARHEANGVAGRCCEAALL